ncbi:DUF1254 domain-containing protein [Pseudomonas sp.]|uniref:DUF1254 domain-containing protein n=1 Tax=Pseudomonas sp. TaxID=306 RepID=UPI002632002B|nr:DUF1254 domain-containing protein [Pseudomonas sp.]
MKLNSSFLAAGLLSWVVNVAVAAPTASPEQAQAIAKEVYLYGYPVVEMYKTLYAQAVDQGGPNFKAPFNTIGNTANVFSPKDTAIITPNSDTPYSFVWLDLRAEPIVLTLPAIEKSRYYSVQLIDIYTHNLGYLGSRTTGNKGGKFLIAGPAWKGETPAGIDKVIRTETNIAYALYRTQLFDEKDLNRVKAIQAGYAVQTLSEFVGKPASAAARPVDWPKPIDGMTDSPALIRYLNFMLTFAPTHPSEKKLMKRFAEIGAGPGLPFDEAKLTPSQTEIIQKGITDGKAEFAAFKKAKIDTHLVTSGEFFGSREHLKNNYLYRYVGANVGIFGNSAAEANYLGYFVDSQGKPVNAGTDKYTLHFNKGGLPPAKAFWSLTMYDGKTKLLVDNPLNRYLINSQMLGSLKTDADGGITLYVQHDSPGKDKESNWLPAPSGPFYGVLRIYMPKPEVTNGQWKLPPLVAAKS